MLLAVDLGLKAGMALYDGSGALRWCRSTHFASKKVLRQAVPSILKNNPGISHLVMEGDRILAEIWEKAARRRHITCERVRPEVWRQSLLLPRQQRTGADAKRHAMQMATEIIRASPSRNPTSLQVDAAEAVLIGYWAVQAHGWAVDSPKQ